MTKQKSLTEKQKEAIIDEVLSKGDFKLDLSDIFDEFEERLANQEKLSGELEEMWEKYLYAFSKVDDPEVFIEKLEAGIRLSDLSPKTKEAYLKILDLQKGLLANRGEENVPGKDGPT